MRTTCAMMASEVTSLVEEERVETDGVQEAGGVVVSVHGRFG